MATYKHLRSSTANKRPTTSIADGQLAINTNTASPGLFFKDSAGTGIVKVGPVHVGTTAPNSTPAGSTGNYLGEQWLDTSVSPAQMKVWNGSAWVGVVADELPVSKLQDGTARQLLQTDAAGTGVEWTSNVDVPGTLDVTSTATFDSIASHPLGSAGAPTITFTGDTNTGIYSPGADQVAISTNGTGRLFVNSSGQVGIGTTPSNFVHLSGSSATQWIQIDGSASALLIGQNTANTHFGITNGTKIMANNASYPFVIGNNQAQPLIFGTSGVETMRIDASGRLGLGTSSVSYKLDINNTGGGNGGFRLLSTDQSTTRIRLENTGTGGRSYEIVGGLTGVNNSTFTVYDATAAATRLAIDSSGNVGVGTTSPSAAISISAATNTNPLAITAASDNYNYLYFNNTSASTRGFLGLSSGLLTSGGNANDIALRTTSNFVVATGGGSERLRIDSSGRVGIGTSSPQAQLHLSKSGTSDYTTLRFSNTGASGRNYEIGVGGSTSAAGYANNLYFYDGTASSVRMVIDSSGRVGIGTTSPSSGGSDHHALTIAGASGTGAGFLAFQDTSGNNDAAIFVDNGSLFLNADYDNATASSNIIFRVDGSSEKARIDSSGRLLVGTTTSTGAPAYPTNWATLVSSSFQVSGDGLDDSSISIQGYGTNAVSSPSLSFAKSQSGTVGSATGLVSNGARLATISFNGDDGAGFTAAASIEAYVDGTPGANDMPGRLVFSTTADGASSPTERMRITSNGDFSFNTPVIGGEGGISIVDGSAGARQFYWRRASTTSASYPVSFNDGSTNVGFISFTNTATTYSTSSDYRLKENVIAVPDGITRLQQLKPSRFNFIADPTKTVDGFLAHEVQTVVPEAITGEKDAVDDEGNPVYQGIDQSKLVPLLTAALQEAVAKIESLEARLTAAGI